MSNRISFQKANYCRSIMHAAAICSCESAERLIDALTTEIATPDTSFAVAEAERSAYRAIWDLAETLHGRYDHFTGMEWNDAGKAVERWIEASK